MRIALTSGLTRKQATDDPDVGMSTLNKWITTHRNTDTISKEDLSVAQENDRLRRKNRILKEEKEVLKKAKLFFASQSNPVTNGLPFMLRRRDNRWVCPLPLSNLTSDNTQAASLLVILIVLNEQIRRDTV